MKRLLLLTVCALMILSGCGLKRSNPLDPIGNGNITEPDQVTGLYLVRVSGTGVPNKFVELGWEANPSVNTDGYYIYRGLSYTSAFARVDTVYAVNNYSHSTNVFPGDYYYMVSAFKDYDGAKLEGRMSQRLFVRVPN